MSEAIELDEMSTTSVLVLADEIGITCGVCGSRALQPAEVLREEGRSQTERGWWLCDECKGGKAAEVINAALEWERAVSAFNAVPIGAENAYEYSEALREPHQALLATVRAWRSPDA